jgi:AhpD family alkylhydroperoxidase
LENQIELKEKINVQWGRYKELMPHIAKAYENLPDQVYKNAAIDGKTKRLMAMTAAVVHGCRACILYQADEALKLGATVDEILECIGVAVSLSGTIAEGESARLIQFLEEKGLI